jgi:tetratricopeptide (TPR) repeat protein
MRVRIKESSFCLRALRTTLASFRGEPVETTNPGQAYRLAQKLSEISNNLVMQGQPDAALELLNEQLEIARSIGDVHLQAASFSNIARIRTDQGELDAALHLHEEALATFSRPR